jgi:serine/threonine protein kinase
MSRFDLAGISFDITPGEILYARRVMMDNKTISHFRILELINEGGMGKIYLAEDTVLQRKVVLKFLPSHLTTNTHLVDRFKREAQAAAALTHPNIVTIYERGEHGGQFYIAMEYIDGINLNELLEEREVSIRKALVIAIQASRGLRKAHGVGIIHRDIKPANIMIDKDGWVKILDFGLAKLTEHTRITEYGVRMGTAPYISPEQLRGDELAPSSDIFSLGVILYQLITRRHPFSGDSDEEIMYSILNREPEPLRRYADNVTVRLQDMVDRALKKDAAQRYHESDDFLSDLKREIKFYANQTASTAAKSLPAGSSPGKPKRQSMLAGLARTRWGRVLVKWLRSSLAPQNIRIKNVVIPVWRLFIIIILLAISVSVYSLQERLHRAQTPFSPIQTLVEVKQTTMLLDKIDNFSRQNLIAMDNHIDFAYLDHCYLFIVDSLEVLDVFAVRDNLFCSLSSKERFTTPPNKFSGNRKIWVQDLTVQKSSLQ